MESAAECTEALQHQSTSTTNGSFNLDTANMDCRQGRLPQLLKDFESNCNSCKHLRSTFYKDTANKITDVDALTAQANSTFHPGTQSNTIYNKLIKESSSYPFAKIRESP